MYYVSMWNGFSIYLITYIVYNFQYFKLIEYINGLSLVFTHFSSEWSQNSYRFGWFSIFFGINDAKTSNSIFTTNYEFLLKWKTWLYIWKFWIIIGIHNCNMLFPCSTLLTIQMLLKNKIKIIFNIYKKKWKIIQIFLSNYEFLSNLSTLMFETKV